MPRGTSTAKCSFLLEAPVDTFTAKYSFRRGSRYSFVHRGVFYSLLLVGELLQHNVAGHIAHQESCCRDEQGGGRRPVPHLKIFILLSFFWTLPFQMLVCRRTHLFTFTLSSSMFRREDLPYRLLGLVSFLESRQQDILWSK